MNKYVDVILPLPLSGTFTYALPDFLKANVFIGSRVIVPFGKKKIYAAVAFKFHDITPTGYEVKDVIDCLDYKSPILFSSQLKLWEWISKYYMSSLGEVFKAALPSGFKLESESVLSFNSSFVDSGELSIQQLKILDLLQKKKRVSIHDIQRLIDAKNILRILKQLIDLKAITLNESLKENYKPRREAHITLNIKYANSSQIHILLDLLAKAPKQQALLLRYLELSNFKAGKGLDHIIISKKELLKTTGISNSVLSVLIKKEIFIESMEVMSRLENSSNNVIPLKSLNCYQQQAFDEINNVFLSQRPCLLFGVTSSGKTEIYIKLIKQYLDKGKQILYLLPEIALTTQITNRLRAVFGNDLGIYHSKFSDDQRVEIWNKQLSDSPFKIVLGVRSSIFLPFSNLGLIIVDEEHETTYKQYDPAPRYNARDASIVLASIHNANVLLGTATPSIETYFNALSGKFGLVKLTHRFNDVKMPDIKIIDIKELQRKKRMKGLFSPYLTQQINLALERNEQVILFQNRRGFAPRVECNTCGWTPKCENCDVSLTYHKINNQLSCHYCGYTYQAPQQCPACGGSDLRDYGFGTEKVEEAVHLNFPSAKISRLDNDTTKSKRSYEKILYDFQEGKTNILIGTQMISKGLDFENVSVVGIINADNMLNFPDFRSYERAFQLISQVSGRSGRKKKQGLVVLQTKSLDNPIMPQIINNDFEGMYKNQMLERHLFKYPPYYRLIYVYLKHRKEDVLEEVSESVAAVLKKSFGDRVLGPDIPLVSRIQSYYIKKISLKIENNSSIVKAKGILEMIHNQVHSSPKRKSILMYYDVDPQ